MRYTIKGKVTKYKQNIVCWRDVSAWPGQWRSFIRAHQCIFEISPFIFQSLNEWIFIIEKQKTCVVCRREVTGGGQGRPEGQGHDLGGSRILSLLLKYSQPTSVHLPTFDFTTFKPPHVLTLLNWILQHGNNLHLFFVTKDIINFCLFIFNLCLSCGTKGFFW